jgi:hypothetical protein
MRLTINGGATTTLAALFQSTVNVSGLATLTNLLLTSSTTLQNFTGINATTTNATSTNHFSTTATTLCNFSTRITESFHKYRNTISSFCCIICDHTLWTNM